MIAKLKAYITSRLTDAHGSPIGQGNRETDTGNSKSGQVTICEVCQSPIPRDEMVGGKVPIRTIHGKPVHIDCHNELQKTKP